MAVRTLKQLNEQLRKVALDALQNDTEVANAVIRVGQDSVQKYVYNAYKPKKYERTYQLKNDWYKENVSEGIKVFNDRRDGDKYIPKVVETGVGYDYTGYGYGYEKPRPFIEETKKELKSNKQHLEALKKSLRNKGYKVK